MTTLSQSVCLWSYLVVFTSHQHSVAICYIAIMIYWTYYSSVRLLVSHALVGHVVDRITFTSYRVNHWTLAYVRQLSPNISNRFPLENALMEVGLNKLILNIPCRICKNDAIHGYNYCYTVIGKSYMSFWLAWTSTTLKLNDSERKISRTLHNITALCYVFLITYGSTLVCECFIVCISVFLLCRYRIFFDE